MALSGYKAKWAEIEAKIAEIQADLRAAAQKRHWAAFREAKEAEGSKAATKRAAPKRKLSADAKAKLVANLAKARAARAAKKVATETLPV